MKINYHGVATALLVFFLLACKESTLQPPNNSKPITSQDLQFQSLGNPTISDLFPCDCMTTKGTNPPKLLRQTPIDQEKLKEIVSRTGIPSQFCFQITITTEGKVNDVVMVEPTGQKWQEFLPVFEATFKQWQYEPVTLFGKGIACRWYVTVNF